MAARPSWRGFLRWSLVSVPVAAINATESGGGKIHLNQLHATCHSRIKYEKVCPTHGPVSQSEIVSGYEYSPGEYVIVSPDELDQVRTEAEKAINLEKFLSPEAVDPLYFSGDTYYLIPDGEAGVKPYSVLTAAMAQANQAAIGQAVFNSRERLVMLRAVEGLIIMSMLKYETELRLPQAISEMAPVAKVSKEELRLAELLLQTSKSSEFNIADYEDVYTARLHQLIDAKIAGEEIVQPPEEHETPVINLMDALKQSVAQAKPTKPSLKAAKPAKKTSAARAAQLHPRRKKTG
ncbi:MAG TPA: Ku protein [Pirellulales bacterium]|nr:Ku protein [Pirellulales bacterium]